MSNILREFWHASMFGVLSLLQDWYISKTLHNDALYALTFPVYLVSFMVLIVVGMLLINPLWIALRLLWWALLVPVNIYKVVKND